MKRKNNTLYIVISILIILLLCGCTGNIQESVGNEEERAAPTKGYYESISKEEFCNDVKKQKEKYDEKQDSYDEKLYELSYYFDFEALPEEFEFEKIIVTSDCQAVDIQYNYEGQIVDVFWFRAIDDPEYDFIKDTRQLFSNYESYIIEANGLNVLKIEHAKGPQCVEAYNQYTFVLDSNNLEVSVPQNLIEHFGEEIFLKIGKIEI